MVVVFSLIWRRQHCRRRASNFDLCSALIAIEQLGFFRSHIYCHCPFMRYEWVNIEWSIRILEMITSSWSWRQVIWLINFLMNRTKFISITKFQNSLYDILKTFEICIRNFWVRILQSYLLHCCHEYRYVLESSRHWLFYPFQQLIGNRIIYLNYQDDQCSYYLKTVSKKLYPKILSYGYFRNLYTCMLERRFNWFDFWCFVWEPYRK